MAEDMGLVASQLSWRTERVNSIGKRKLDLDEKRAQRIRLCRQRATPVRRVYEASKESCKDDLKTGYVAAAKELPNVSQKAHLNEGALDTETQKHVYAIMKKPGREIARLQAQIKEAKEQRDRHAKELRNNHEGQYYTLMDSVHTSKKSLPSTIKERQALLGRSATEAEAQANTARDARACFEREHREEQDAAEREEGVHRKREKQAEGGERWEQGRARKEEDTRKR